MAQLKDTIIQGDARVTDTLYANEINGETFLTGHLVLDTSTNAVSIEQNQLEFLSNTDVSYAKIVANTSGLLGLFSKRIICVFPGDTSSAGVGVGATNEYQNTDGLYLFTNMVKPIKNNTMSLGEPIARWSKIYTTALSVGNNENDTTYPFYVYDAQSRFFLSTSNHSVADRKFTIAGGSGTNIYEMSLGSEAIQAYTSAQAVKNLFLQPRGGNLLFGQPSSISTTAYSFYPNQNNKHTLGTSSYKWADLYATLISPDKVRVNTNLTWDVSAYDFYVSGFSRFYLGSSNHGVADRKFTIIGSNELSFGDEGIQAFNTSQVVKTLYLQPRGGDLIFGPASSVSTTAYSFKPNQDNQHNLGTSSNKWANIYSTAASIDTITTSLLKINTTSNAAASTLTQLDFANGTTSYGVISANTTGSLTLRSKRILAFFAAQPIGTGTAAANYQSTNGVYISNSELYPAGTMSIGTSSAKWANVYATTATLNGLSVVGGDIVMSEASGHGATHKLIFQRGTATDGYTNWKLYNDSVGVLTLQAYHNGLDADTDILQVLCPTASQTPALVPGTTNSYDIGSSSLVWRNIYATNLNINVVTCPSSTAASVFSVGVDFVDATVGRRGHIGASTTEGAVGIYAAGNVYLRPSCTTASGATTFTSTHGVVVTSAAMYPAGTSTLGSSTAQWATTYSKQYTVDTHVTLAYDSTDKSLNFNFA